MRFKGFLLLLLNFLLFNTTFAQDMIFGINKDDVYVTEDGHYKSWIMDELKEWGREENINISFEIAEWNTLEEKFYREDIQGLYPANKINSRLNFMEFTKSIISEPFCILSKERVDISSLKDLDRKRVGTLESRLLREELSPLFKGIRYYKNLKDAFDGLSSGEIDYFIINKGVTYSFPDEADNIGELWFENEGRIAIQKGDSDTVASLNDHFFSGEHLKPELKERMTQEETEILRCSLKKSLRVTTPMTLNMVVHKDAFPFIEVRDGIITGSLVRVVEDFNTLSSYIKLGIVPLENQGEFNDELAKLASGEIDAMAPVGMTSERDAMYRGIFPGFFLEKDTVTLFAHGSAPKVENIYEIKGTLGTVNSHLLEEMAYSNLPSDRVVVYEDRIEALKDLNSNKISYLLDTDAIVHGFALLNKYSNVKKMKSLQDLSYGVYLSPLVTDDVVSDINLIADTMNEHGKFKNGGAFYNSSVTPVFIDKYLLQLKILVVVILLLIIYYQRKGLGQRVQNEKILNALIGSLESVNHVNNEETGEHIVRIGLYSEIIAKSLNLPRRLVGEIKTFSSLHDVGKVAIPPEILKKPGKLTDEEFDIMKTHTERGRDIIAKLSGIPSKEDLATNIVLYHHERWDGSGYPEGLVGVDIPLEARIVALADVYDALRMPRAYKRSFSHQETYDIILEGSGKHFDPELVEIFKVRHRDFYKIYDANS